MKQAQPIAQSEAVRMNVSDNRVPGKDVSAIYARARAKIDQEDNLITQRIGWLLSSQGFFFVALGLFANSRSNSEEYQAVLAILGIAVSLGVLLAVINASHAISEIQEWWFDRTEGLDTSDTPPLIGKPKGLADARFAFYGIPVVTIFVWLVVLVSAFSNCCF